MPGHLAVSIGLAARLLFQDPIEGVAIEGTIRVPVETVRHYLGDLGEMPFSENALRRAFRSLWESGLFEDVRFERVDGPSGAGLRVHVEEKRVVSSFRFEGAGELEDDLRRALRERGIVFLPNAPFGTAELVRAERGLEVILGEEWDVRLTASPVEGHRVEVVAHVERRSFPRLARIAFRGNESVSSEDLRDVLSLRASSWASFLTRRDRLRPGRLASDLERLRALYRRRGHLAAVVGPPSTEAGGDGSVRIEIPIREGPRFALDTLIVEPGPLLTRDEVRAWLGELSGAGEHVDGAALDAVARRLERHYRSRGYPNAVAETLETLDGDAGSADIRLRVREGAFYRVGRVDFRGHVRHRDADLRWYLELVETEPFDESELEAGTRLLSNAGQFRSVRPEVDLTSTPGRARVLYHLEETKPFEYLVGGGLNGTQGGTGTGQFLARGLLRRGEVFRAATDLGDRFRSVELGYRDASSLGRRRWLAVDFARARLRFPDETEEDFYDAALRIGGPLGAKLQVAGALSWGRFTLDSNLPSGEVPFLTPFLGRRFRSHRAALSIVFDGRDRPVFPSRGLSLDLGARYAGGVLGGDVESVRLHAAASNRWRLHARGHSLVLSGRVEAVRPFGQTRDEGLPRFERLFLGSENDLRGFEIRGVGPRSDDAVVGGDRLAFATAEYHHVVAERLHAVAFFDLGHVGASDFTSPEPGPPAIRYDAGGEARILVPVANVPLRVGYGVNLDRFQGEPRGRFFLSFALRF